MESIQGMQFVNLYFVCGNILKINLSYEFSDDNVILYFTKFHC
jgi:hypothetical protein